MQGDWGRRGYSAELGERERLLILREEAGDLLSGLDLRLRIVLRRVMFMCEYKLVDRPQAYNFSAPKPVCTY